MKMTMGGKARGLIGIMIATMVLLSSCTTPLKIAEKALANGDYIGAVEASLHALDEDPGLPEAQQILGTAWRRANAEWEAEIEKYESSEDVWQIDKTIGYYDRLVYIHMIVQDAGMKGLDPTVDPNAWMKQYDDAKRELAEKHVFEGSKLVVPGTRDEALVALTHYERAKELNPEYPFIDRSLEKARDLALAKVFVFTGPEKDVTLNGVELIPAIEDGLDKLDGVQVVRVPNRYAAPIDDNHDADEFAKAHKANMMLHIEPTTVKSVGIVNESRPLKSVSWERKTLRLEASATTDIRYVLINLQNDTIVSEGTFSISDADDGGFEISAILHGKDVRSVDLGEALGSRKLNVNFAPVGENSLGLSAKLKIHDNLDIPDYASGSSLGIAPATYGTGEKIKVGEYSHPSELARITDLRDHTFWLFDAIAYDSYGDGDFSFQLVYQRTFEDGVGGHLATSSYEKELYGQIESWMRQIAIQREVLERFFPTFYKSTVPAQIVGKVAPLF